MMPVAARSRLPDRRPHELFNLEHGGIKYTVGIGRYGDGRIAEIFLNAGKDGSTIDANARDHAVTLSLLLQHNFPLESLRHAVGRTSSGAPAGILGALLDFLCAEGCGGQVAPPMLSPPAIDGVRIPVLPADEMMPLHFVVPAMLVSTKTPSEHAGSSL